MNRKQALKNKKKAIFKCAVDGVFRIVKNLKNADVEAHKTQIMLSSIMAQPLEYDK